MNRKQKKMLYRIIGTAVIFTALQFIPLPGMVRLIIYILAYLLIGYDILIKAGRGIVNGRVFDENFLMALASVGAFVMAVCEGTNEPREAVGVMLFYQLGELFQSYAVGKSRKNIAALMDIRPDYANIETEKGLEQIDPEEVQVGSLIVIQPGERVPIDGIVTEGSTAVNTAALTGESLPRDISVNDEIISGSINMTGLIKVRTTKEFGESTVSKILELTENASSRKSRSEQFISKFARVYTPVVCLCAVALAVIPPIVRTLIMGMPAEWSVWIYRALTFLVISCPCALVISIPLSFFGGIGGAGSRGILIKGSNYMEALSRVNTVVLDKTGTLTRGEFEVVGILCAGEEDELVSVSNETDREKSCTGEEALTASEDNFHRIADRSISKETTTAVAKTPEQKRLLEYAAYAECASSHPISMSIRRAYASKIERSRVLKLEETGGFGVEADLIPGGVKISKNMTETVFYKNEAADNAEQSVNNMDGITPVRVAVGNVKLMNKLGITLPKQFERDFQRKEVSGEGETCEGHNGVRENQREVGENRKGVCEGQNGVCENQREAGENRCGVCENQSAAGRDQYATGRETIIHVAIDGKYAGCILVADAIKPTSAAAMSELKKQGISRTVMLTGDNKNTAEAVAASLGIDEVMSELLPSDKVRHVETLLAKLEGDSKLAFVGDGINDAPVLMRSDVGIAMGALGSDAAIEAADVVLMDDDPMKIAEAIRISRKCLKIVYENIVFSLGVKLICLCLGAFGIANMWLAVFADVGVCVIAVLNAIRALKA